MYTLEVVCPLSINEALRLVDEGVIEKILIQPRNIVLHAFSGKVYSCLPNDIETITSAISKMVDKVYSGG